MMNAVQVHVIFNHVPIIGIPFASLLLLAGLAKKSRDLVQASMVAFIVIGILTYPAVKSGGPSAHIAIGLPGVEKQDIHEHAAAAKKDFYMIEALAILGIVGFVLLKKSSSVPTGFGVLVFIVSLVVSAWTSYVGHLGGEIRHPELEMENPPASAPAPAAAQPPQTESQVH